MDQKVLNKIIISQKNEITEYHIYKKLAATIKDESNRKVVEKIADDELRHYKMWKTFTKKDVAPNKFKIWKYYLLSRIFGLTFGLKLMERGEENAQESYQNLGLEAEEVDEIIREEKVHENKLLKMLNEEFLQYTSSMVLGLNDALVELTGALAGFTLALKNSKLIALVGLVTGIAASLSMASSEYLSTKADSRENNGGSNGKNPIKASIYTGIAYLVTVILLILPYFFIKNYYYSLAVTLATALLIILVFNYYISIAKDLPFLKQFLEMALLSLGIAGLSFFIGHILRSVIGVDI